MIFVEPIESIGEGNQLPLKLRDVRVLETRCILHDSIVYFHFKDVVFKIQDFLTIVIQLRDLFLIYYLRIVVLVDVHVRCHADLVVVERVFLHLFKGLLVLLRLLLS